MEIDPPIVNVKAQKGKEQKLKAKGLKTPVSIDVSKRSVTTSIKDSKGKTAESSIISKENVENNFGSSVAGDVSVSCAEDTMTENGEGPSTEGLGVNVDTSIKDSVDGMKDSTSLGGDVLQPSVNDKSH
ncbi:hypothetical protein LIER_19591 [Lithospermum erythrorhizon]|uniref:Uncharacterized protein n=1 Tax=Lithospermum erythrorhizon TaxID=34254 RepID=A0AAV3QKY7_LITER